MFTNKVWMILAMTLVAAPLNAEQIKIAYSGVSPAGALCGSRKMKGFLPGMD